MRHSVLTLVLLPATAGVVACTDHVSGPLTPGGTIPVAQIMGDLPTAALVEVDEILYDAVSDVIELRLGVNRGIVTATISGNGEFAVRVSLVVRDGTNSSGVLGPVLKPLIDKLAEPRPDPFFDIWTQVGWNGSSEQGDPMGTTLTADYELELLRIGADGIEQSLGSTSGTMLVSPKS